MAETTVVHLLRHGEVHNPDGVLYGRLPGFHLSPEGEHMAKAAAAFLAGRDVTLLLSSPLERALETAAPVAAQFGLEVRVDERLIEPTNVYEGTTFGVGSGALRHPADWRYLYNPFRPSWGEPYKSIAARMLAAIADAARAARGHEVVIQAGAGEGSAIADSDFKAAGAQLVATADEVWAEADLVLKVKEPIAAEYGRLRPDLVLFTYLHLAADEPLTREQMADEFLLMGLRLAEGIDPARYARLAGRPLNPQLRQLPCAQPLAGARPRDRDIPDG